MRSSRIVSAFVLSFVVIGAEAASTPAFTATGANCSDITWQADITARFPSVGKACQAVVQRGGKTYVMFKGKVQRRAGARGLYMRFDGGDEAILVNPPPDLVARIGNQTLKVRDALPGQELTVYVPSDEFVASFDDETAVDTNVVIEEVIPVAEVDGFPDEARPAETASSAPTTPPAVAPAPMPAQTIVPTPVQSQSNEKFWLIVVSIAVVIIVLAVITSRRTETGR